ncbi:hypothetical protein [Streptomyces gobitricini]|uniref:7-dehydrocholesterol reductase n=1 Tax=Streptomyces gobitricini TaxID=68211 RepID=A0ABP6AEB6_9ACTN
MVNDEVRLDRHGVTPDLPKSRSRVRGSTVFLRCFLFPLVLIAVTPSVVLLLWGCGVWLDGSLAALVTPAGFARVLRHLPAPSLSAALMICGFVLFQAVLLKLLPGRVHRGPVTPAGVRPVYRANGIGALLVTHAVFLGASAGLRLFPAGILYDRFGSLLITACLLCFGLCLVLYYRGLRRPSGPDAGSTGHPVLDYFWGTELHPSVRGLDLKQLFNCRVGMMSWSLLTVSFGAAQYERTGSVSSAMAVSAFLQLAYILKFFYWEDGYCATLDIMHDRFGYYLCWGVTVWLPGVYTLAGHYLVTHPRQLSWTASAALLLLGLTALALNYSADEQKQRVRRTHGETRVWGSPPKLIHARFTTGDGETHRSLLLYSGWWGLARHFHYLPEFLVALAWTLPVGHGHALPYFYLVYLAVLLLDRCGRDERRCREKYGAAYEEYCQKVRWRIIPRVY